MTIAQHIQAIQDATPSWVNWFGIIGTAVLSWVQPIAGLVAITWGLLQIYLAVEKRWFKKHK